MDHTSWILLGLTAIGAFLRLYGLEIQSLWYDELATWRLSQGNGAADIWDVARTDKHPPGYTILMYYWQAVFGSSEAALRMSSAIAGVLSIPAIYLLGRDLYSRSEGLIAATLLAVAWTPIRYSQEARAYALLILLAIVSSWLLLRLARDLNRTGKFSWLLVAAYVLSAAAACYLHYFGVVLVLFQAVAYTVGHWNRLPALFKGLGLFTAVGVLYAPWLVETLKDLKTQHFWASPPEPVLLEFHEVFQFLLDGEAGAFLGYILIGFLLMKAGWSWRNELSPWYRAPTLFLLAWLVFPFAVAYMKSMISAPIMVPRYFLISLPAVYLLMAHALVQLVDDPLKRRLATVSVALVFLGNLLFGAEYYTSVSKEQFREAVGEVVAHESEYPNALLVGWSGAHQAGRKRMFDYYFQQSGSNQSLDVLAGTQQDAIRLIRYLERLRPAYFWFVYGHKEPDPRFARALTGRYEVVRAKRLHEAGAILFRTGFEDELK